MAATPSTPPAQPISAYIVDGVRVAAILLVWGVIAAFFVYGVSDIGGFPLESLWFQLGRIFALTGVLNALLYLVYRGIDYWRVAESSGPR